MQHPNPRAALCAALLSSVLLAQVGNEVVFVGSSTSGSADEHCFAESATGNVLVATGTGFTDNVTDALWTDQGRRLYVGQSLMNQVAVADWDGTSATWSTFYAAPGACYGVEYDLGRKRLWTLTGAGSSSRELVCLDADLSSPTYGQFLGQTSGLTGVYRERWALSFSGNLACVPVAIISGSAFTLVDTDPQSATYLQVTTTAPMTGVTGGFVIASDVEISIDDAYAYVLWSGISGTSVVAGLAVWDVGNGAWLDFDPAPGQQDFAIPLAVPNLMDLSLDRSFMVLSGQGGAGWAGRIDFDYQTPSNSTFTQYQGLTVPDCNGASLSPDQSRVAVTSTPGSLSPPSELVVLDAATGAVLQTVALPAMWNVYTTAWQDGSPLATYALFGSGCPGALGVPALQPSTGSRPAQGQTFSLEVSNLPFGFGLVATGFSRSQTSGGLPLPFDLTVVGMPGCSQLVDALVLDVVQGPGTTATWSFAVPSNPVLFGFVFYNQAFSLDPAANGFGFAASNAGAATLGY